MAMGLRRRKPPPPPTPPLAPEDPAPIWEQLEPVLKEPASRWDAALVHNLRLEMFAAAYLKMTDIPPADAVLCQQMGSDGVMRWWFERKT
jgi:hypothetical protein